MAANRALMADPIPVPVLAADPVLTENPVPDSVLATEAGLEVQGTKANVLNPAEMAATVTLEEKSSLIQAYMHSV